MDEVETLVEKLAKLATFHSFYEIISLMLHHSRNQCPMFILIRYFRIIKIILISFIYLLYFYTWTRHWNYWDLNLLLLLKKKQIFRPDRVDIEITHFLLSYVSYRWLVCIIFFYLLTESIVFQVKKNMLIFSVLPKFNSNKIHSGNGIPFSKYN